MTTFNYDAMGVETSENVFTLEADAGIAYAKATNDPIAVHTDGTFIPPIYAVVPVWEKVFEIVSTVVPQEHFFSIVHGEQDMIFHEPLKAGTKLRSNAIGQSISVKESGTTLVVKTQSFNDETGALAIEQYFTMFFRGVDGGQDYGNPHSTGLDLDKYNSAMENETADLIVVRAHIDDDQTQRYADASGDRMPIHLDDDFAKSVGLPGIIVHGLCTMAHASWAAITQLCDSDPARLKRIAVRFSKPLFPGDDLLTIFVKSDDAQPASDTYMFRSVRESDSSAILTNAFVEVRS